MGDYVNYDQIVIGSNPIVRVPIFDAVKLGLNQNQKINQGDGAVAIGVGSGKQYQGNMAVALGFDAGRVGQDPGAVAVGPFSGLWEQGNAAIAIGSSAGNYMQNKNAVAIGEMAGMKFQGSNSIAIGAFAGNNSQAANSIVINASGTALDTSNSGMYVDPIRYLPGVYNSYLVHYDAASRELYSSNILTQGRLSNSILPSNISVDNLEGRIELDNLYGNLPANIEFIVSDLEIDTLIASKSITSVSFIGNGSGLTHLPSVLNSAPVPIPSAQVVNPGTVSARKTTTPDVMTGTPGTIRFFVEENATETRLKILVKKTNGNTVGISFGLTENCGIVNVQ